MSQPENYRLYEARLRMEQWCPCHLRQIRLDYEDRDIINTENNYREMVQKTRQPYQPCVQIDDVMLADVSGDEVEHYLVSRGLSHPAMLKPMFPPIKHVRITGPLLSVSGFPSR